MLRYMLCRRALAVWTRARAAGRSRRGGLDVAASAARYILAMRLPTRTPGAAGGSAGAEGWRGFFRQQPEQLPGWDARAFDGAFAERVTSMLAPLLPRLGSAPAETAPQVARTAYDDAVAELVVQATSRVARDELGFAPEDFESLVAARGPSSAGHHGIKLRKEL